MKKFVLILMSLLFAGSLAACGSNSGNDASYGEGADYIEDPVVHEPPPDEPVLMDITITTDQQTLEGVLFDNETGRGLAAMLPLTVELWDPAPGFAKAFDLPEQIPDVEQRTRQYEKGGLAYWYEGPSIAMFHGDYLEQTIVPVVTVGRITSDVDFLDEYRGNITITGKEEVGASGQGNHILIAYFSVPEDMDTSGVDAVAGASVVVKDGITMGNTEYVAQVIQETIGGDLFRIETVQEYPLDHDPLVDQAAVEQDKDARPELATHIENPEVYDTVILGFPNWWADLPQPLYTFLEEYNFEGKTIIPFVTHGGSGFSNTVNTISRLQPGALVSDNTLSLSRNSVAGSRDEVIAWAESLELGGIS